MRQPTDSPLAPTQPTTRPVASTVPAPARASLGALVLRLAVAVLLLAGLTVLASVAFATTL